MPAPSALVPVLWPEPVLAAILVAAALAVILPKALFDPADTVDMKYFWHAGRLWAEGREVYGPAYAETGAARFQGLHPPGQFFYPPNWWPVARAIAALDYAAAQPVWRTLSVAIYVLGTALALAVAGRQNGGIRPLRAGAAIAYAAGGTATAIAVSLGQSSPLLFLGVCLFVAAWSARHRGLMAAALVALALKPTLGLALAALLLPAPYWRRSLLAAGAVTLAMAAPVFLAHGFGATLQAWLGIVGGFDGLATNTPAETTGIRNLVAAGTGVVLSSTVNLALGCVAIGLVGVVAVRRGQANPELHRASAELALAVAALAVTLHTYDLTFLALFLVTGASAPPALRHVQTALVALSFQPETVTRALGFAVPGEIFAVGSHVASWAILGLVVVAAIRFARALRPSA